MSFAKLSTYPFWFFIVHLIDLYIENIIQRARQIDKCIFFDICAQNQPKLNQIKNKFVLAHKKIKN